MLRDVRRLHAPELDAWHEQVDVRTPTLRVGTQRGRHVASDFALLQRASPFLHHLRRPQLTILLDGTGRIEEGERRGWLEAGHASVSDTARGGTEGFAGGACRWLVLDWDPAAWGATHAGAFHLDRLDRRTLHRLDAAARELEGPRCVDAVVAIVALLRAWGLALAPATAADLEARGGGEGDAAVHAAFAEQLSQLDAAPSMQDLVDALGSNERQLHRQATAIARRYGLPWSHWRGALRHTRILQAMRLLAAPGATTEAVARLTGFRAAAALCHAFAKRGLPSPGVLARAATRDVLDAWIPFAGPPGRAGQERAA